MAKRKISAKEAVADIRAGMDDSALMEKYNLSSEGLQSLFDKLVNAGFIDISEMASRLRGFLGTVVISEYAPAQQDSEVRESPLSPNRKPPRIHAQQAARDIRLGMNDSALMEKYRLSSKGLQSLFDKLISAGLMTQVEIDRRHLEIDNTVDLSEEMLSLSAALHYFEAGYAESSRGGDRREPKQLDPGMMAKENAEPAPSWGEIDMKKLQEVWGNPDGVGAAWYDKPVIVALLLIGLFPLGFYALYRNSTFSSVSKTLIAVAWVISAIACLTPTALQFMK